MLKKSIHRDLKPENIVIEYTDNDKLNFNVKLTNFGLSTFGTSIRTHSLAGKENIIHLKLIHLIIIINVIFGV